MAIEHRMLGQIFSCGSETQRIAYLQTLQWNFYGFLSPNPPVLLHLARGPGDGPANLELVLRRKALGAGALIYTAGSGAGWTLSRRLSTTCITSTPCACGSAQKTLGGSRARRTPAHQERLTAWHAEKDRREAERPTDTGDESGTQDARGGPPGRGLCLTGGGNARRVCALSVYNFHAIPAHGEPKWDPARYVAFVLPAGDPDYVQMIDLGEAEPIDQMIATYRAYLMGEAETNRQAVAAAEPGAALGRALRTVLFDPGGHRSTRQMPRPLPGTGWGLESTAL